MKSFSPGEHRGFPCIQKNPLKFFRNVPRSGRAGARSAARSQHMQKRRLRRSVGFGSGETSPAHCLARGTATLCLSLALTLQLNLASAQQKSWSGNSNTDGNWSRRQNWTSASSSPLNNGTAILTFGASTRTNSAVDTAWSVSSMTFASGASAFRFSGSTLTFNGGLTNNSSAAQTFNNQVALSSAQTWNNSAGTMSFAGGITNRGFTLGVTGGGNSSVSGVFSGAGGLNKSGTGTSTDGRHGRSETLCGL